MKQTPSSDSANRKLRRQQRLTDKYKRESKRLKWSTAIAGTVVVLLIVWLGMATDWTAGLRKANVAGSGALPAGISNGTASLTPGTTAGSSTTGSNEKTNTSTTTGSNTTSTTTSTTPTDGGNSAGGAPQPTPPSSDLLSLYSNTAAGNSLSSVLQRADTLGISNDCHTELLIQTCTFTQNGDTVNVSEPAGTNLITSVTKNF